MAGGTPANPAAPVGSWGLAQRVDARQFSVEARVVQAVADHEAVGNDKALEIDGDLDGSAGRPVEQGRKAQGGRLHPADAPGDGLHSVARVNDVLDEEHVAAVERAIDHVGEAKVATGRPRDIARGAHELELRGDAETAE